MKAFENEMTVRLSVGHILVLWDLLQGKLSRLHATHELNPGEKRALWGLEDICERSLVSAGYSCLPDAEWRKVVEEAGKYAEQIPADFVE